MPGQHRAEHRSFLRAMWEWIFVRRLADDDDTWPGDDTDDTDGGAE